MEKFKIENFLKTYPTSIFPQYEELREEECCEIVKQIIQKYDILQSTSLGIVKALDSMQEHVECAKVDDVNYDLKQVFIDLGIQPLDKVFVNWYHFDHIDTMLFDDLAQYFDDIWYPGSDDIDLFDASLNWMFSIAHDGFTKLLRKERNK